VVQIMAQPRPSISRRPGSSSFPVRHLLQPRGAYSLILGRAAKDGEPARRAKAPPAPRADRESIGSDLRHSQYVG
jgi:hypothetical protein